MESQLLQPITLRSELTSSNSSQRATTQASPLLGPAPAPFPVEQLHDCDAGSELSDGSYETVYYDYDDMTEINLAGMQRACVDALERLLPSSQSQASSEHDQKLSTALGELLEASYELETFHPSSACCSPATPPTQIEEASPFEYLLHVLVTMQTAVAQRQPPSLCPSPPAHAGSASPTSADLHPTVVAFREEIAYARVDSLAAAVIQLVRDRRTRSWEQEQFALPPLYRRSDVCSVESLSSHCSSPPSYMSHRRDKTMLAGNAVASSSSLEFVRSIPGSPKEKMSTVLQDLDTVTSAIERLNHIAPQLQDQRAAMRPEPVRRRAAKLQREARMRELDRIWDMIEAAHGPSRCRGVYDEDEARERRMSRSRVNLHAELKETASQLREPKAANTPETNLARAHELRERNGFLSKLVESANTKRMDDQDTPLRTSAERAEALMDQIVGRTEVSRLNQQDYPISLEQFLAQKHVDNASPSPKGKSKSRRFNLLDAAAASTTSLLSFSSAKESVTAKETVTTPKTPRSKRQYFLDVLSRNSSSTKLTDSPEVPLPPPSTPQRLVSPSSPGRPNYLGSSSLLSLSESLSPYNMVNGVSTPSRTQAISPAAVHVDTLGYICEHQENLRKIAVMVYGTMHPPNLELDVATSGDAIVTSPSDAALRFHVALPTPVPLGQVAPLLPAEGFFEARVNALPTPSSAITLSSTITHAFSAPHLRQLAPRSICCNNCDRRIADFPSDIQFKDLPSEHWAEMLEAWMCHSDPAFTAHIAKQTQDGFWPTTSTVLVGGSYLLVAGGAICDSSLRVSHATPTDDWRTVTCPCSQVLGKEKITGPGNGSIRFSKWAIAVMHGRGGGEIEHTHFPPSVFVVSDMLELSQAHASHRFVISDEETNQTRLALWLFNPSMRVAYRKPTGSPRASPSPRTPKRRSGSTSPRSVSSSREGPTDQAKSFRAAKVMYSVLDGGSCEHLHGFAGQVEQLTYPLEVCEKLQFALQQSTSVYPPARREFNGFDCGFLERV